MKMEYPKQIPTAPPDSVDPPAYTTGPDAATNAALPTEVAKPLRSICDLRAQIIANCSIIRPKNNPSKSSDDHIEIIVGKVVPRDALAHLRRPGYDLQVPASEKAAVASSSSSMRSTTSADVSVASSSSSNHKHYAVLVRRSTSYTLKIIMRSEPQNTVEEALEWLLDQTELVIHDRVMRYGRKDDEGCVLM